MCCHFPRTGGGISASLAVWPFCAASWPSGKGQIAARPPCLTPCAANGPSAGRGIAARCAQVRPRAANGRQGAKKMQHVGPNRESVLQIGLRAGQQLQHAAPLRPSLLKARAPPWAACSTVNPFGGPCCSGPSRKAGNSAGCRESESALLVSRSSAPGFSANRPRPEFAL